MPNTECAGNGDLMRSIGKQIYSVACINILDAFRIVGYHGAIAMPLSTERDSLTGMANMILY